MIDVANGLNDINALNVLHDLNVLKVKDKDLTPSIQTDWTGEINEIDEIEIATLQASPLSSFPSVIIGV
jgi:hypothetical protein